MIINETWLNEYIHSNEIVDENFYRIFRSDRSAEDMDGMNNEISHNSRGIKASEASRYIVEHKCDRGGA